MDVIRRKPTKEDENVKLLVPRGLREKGPSLLGFLKLAKGIPASQPSSETRQEPIELQYLQSFRATIEASSSGNLHLPAKLSVLHVFCQPNH